MAWEVGGGQAVQLQNRGTDSMSPQSSLVWGLMQRYEVKSPSWYFFCHPQLPSCFTPDVAFHAVRTWLGCHQTVEFGFIFAVKQPVEEFTIVFL